MKKQPYELTYEETNNFIEKNKDGNVLYHAIRDSIGNLSKADIRDNIVKNGFIIGKREGSLACKSISFFVEKEPARAWSDVIVGYQLPERAKLINYDSEEFKIYQNWCLKKGYKQFDVKEYLLEYGGYHGVICEANGGTEYRIYDQELLSEGVAFGLGHKLTVLNALKEGKDVPEHVLNHYHPSDFDINLRSMQENDREALKSFISSKYKSNNIKNKRSV